VRTFHHPGRLIHAAPFRAFLSLSLVSLLAGCGGRPARTVTDDDRRMATAGEGGVQRGYATWYGPGLAGNRTSNGERFQPSAYTAAHRTLPFGTWVSVTRIDTGKSVRVRINDRGPWGKPERIIDVAQGPAKVLDLTHVGVAEVEVRVVPAPAGR
jgi:rare lipoprotein A (peptidoglycan hydrolase)